MEKAILVSLKMINDMVKVILLGLTEECTKAAGSKESNMEWESLKEQMEN
jgi:hypothetical protein